MRTQIQYECRDTCIQWEGQRHVCWPRKGENIRSLGDPYVPFNLLPEHDIGVAN